MPATSISRILPYRAKDLFDIAADVGAYKEFLPLCSYSSFEPASLPEASGVIKGRGTIGIRKPEYGIDQVFASEVTGDPAALTVISVSQEPPVKNLYSKWSFTDLGEAGTRVEYEVDFEFRNLALRLLMAKFFHLVVNRVVTAFEARAKAICTPVNSGG